MTTTFDFRPSNLAPFQFQPTLDGTTYTCIVSWNLFGQRFYLDCYTLAGDLVFSQALISSPDGVQIQAISWAKGVATVTTNVPHGLGIGLTANITISGTTPDGYNGLQSVYSISPTQFTYSLTSNPGAATMFGNAIANINMAAGYFTTSTLVFRESTSQFEVSP
jgi:hypothetical protein